jgi:hypothetical protein
MRRFIMLRFLFLCFLLIPAPLHAEVSLEQALDMLVTAPWEKSPTNLPDTKSWMIVPYTIHNTGELQGYDLRAFERNSDSLILKLFTYAEPSLTSSGEMILMGYVQGISQTEEEAKPLLAKMAAYMRSLGFVASAPDSVTKQMAAWKLIQSCTFLKKRDMNCAVYLKEDFRENGWQIRTMVFHPRFQEFRNNRMAEWPKYWDSIHIMPYKLISELEDRKISQILSPGIWDKIKGISSSSTSSLRKSNTTAISELIKAYETIDKITLAENDLPAFLLFRNYLVRYLFIRGLENEISPEQREWLESRGIEYSDFDLGNVRHYEETFLQKLIDKYPDSSWGQFAFLEMLERGFDTSGMCRGGQNQWKRVLSEGAVFLEKYPGSEFVPDIRFYMGQAEETLFTLGTIKDNPFMESSGLSWEQYADQSEYARKKAIGYYDEVLRSSQKSVYENYLKYVLPRLRAGFATGCHYYFCFYD